VTKKFQWKFDSLQLPVVEHISTDIDEKYKSPAFQAHSGPIVTCLNSF
jgi:hypothetical protein